MPYQTLLKSHHKSTCNLFQTMSVVSTIVLRWDSTNKYGIFRFSTSRQHLPVQVQWMHSCGRTIKLPEPTCADDDDSDWDQIRSFQHHGKRDATSSWTVFEILLLPDPNPDPLRFGSVRWNDARVSACLIDISFVSLSEEKPRTVNASAVRAGKCQQVQLSLWGRRGSELKLTAQTSARTMRRLLQRARERERKRERERERARSVGVLQCEYVELLTVFTHCTSESHQICQEHVQIIFTKFLLEGSGSVFMSIAIFVAFRHSSALTQIE